MDNEEDVIYKDDLIPKVLDDFIKRIESIAETYPITINVINDAVAKASEEFVAYGKIFSQKIEESKRDKEHIYSKLTIEDTKQFLNVTRRTEKSILAGMSVQRSFIISLISQYDAFLGRLIRALFLIQPDLLNASGKNITFSQLQEFESIDAAKEYIIE